jgi:hypothetical protein
MTLPGEFPIRDTAAVRGFLVADLGPRITAIWFLEIATDLHHYSDTRSLVNHSPLRKALSIGLLAFSVTLVSVQE